MSELWLHLFVAQGQLVPDDVGAIFSDVCPSVALNISTFDIKDHQIIRTLLSRNADVVALPLYHSSTFYRAVPRLRRTRTIVHLTDGVGDQFSMLELQRAVFAKSPPMLIKRIAVISLLRLCRADIEFSHFHPRTSPYAKRSLSVGAFPITKAKQNVLSSIFDRERPEALIVEGFDLSADQIATEAGITRYVATKRSGGIDVCGQDHLPDQVVCAEEVLQLMRPKVVIGCPSTSLVVARLVYDDVPVMCITTPEAERVRGYQFNRIFRRYARRYGINVSEHDDVERQFAVMRRWLAVSQLPTRLVDESAA